MLRSGNGREQRADIPHVTPRPGSETVENKTQVVFLLHKQAGMGSDSLLEMVLTARN